MQRVVEQFVALGELDDPAEIHHRDPLAEMPDHRQIVRDEQIGQVELVAQILEQIDDLRLDRYVESRNRLVADDEFRVQRQGPRDSDPLPLAARHLMRISVGEIRVEAAHRQQLAHPVEAPPRVFLDTVHHHRLANDRADLLARVQGAVGILEDDLDAAPQRHQLATDELGDVDAVVEDLAGSRLFEPQDAAAHRRLAATALADQPQGFAAADRQIDAVHRLDVPDMAPRDQPLGHREMHPQAAHLQQRLRVGGCHRHAAPLMPPLPSRRVHGCESRRRVAPARQPAPRVAAPRRISRSRTGSAAGTSNRDRAGSDRAADPRSGRAAPDAAGRAAAPSVRGRSCRDGAGCGRRQRRCRFRRCGRHTSR